MHIRSVANGSGDVLALNNFDGICGYNYKRTYFFRILVGAGHITGQTARFHS